MHRIPGWLVLVCVMLAGSIMAESEKPGFVEGHINIGPLTPVEREGAPSPTVPAEGYADLQLAIFKADGKTKVAALTVDKEGNFRQSLAPGIYVVAMPLRRMTKANLPKTITIVSDQTVRVDIEIDTGIR
jgi:hypothetical protein